MNTKLKMVVGLRKVSFVPAGNNLSGQGSGLCQPIFTRHRKRVAVVDLAHIITPISSYAATLFNSSSDTFPHVAQCSVRI